MSVNLIIAAGLFDSPWTIAIFLLAGAIINWLSKRRADNAAGNQTPEDAPESNPSPVSNWEERLRRMLEEKNQQKPAPTAAPPTQAPPIIRRAPVPRPAVPPVLAPVERPAPPALRPPPVQIISAEEMEFSEPTVRRYELSDAAHAAQAKLATDRRLQSRTKRPILGSLRNPQTARQAFATSLVFGPPKGLEL